MTTNSLRFSRQENLIPSKSIEQFKASVIGLGSVGSHVADVLVRLGIQHLDLFDLDSVDVPNISPSVYGEGDVGRSKVRAIRRVIESFDSCVFANTHQICVTRHTHIPHELVFICLDSMKPRREIWMANKYHNPRWYYWIDARMGRDQCEIYCVTRDNLDQYRMYEQQMPEVDHTPACGEKATAFITKGFVSGFVGNLVYDIVNNRQPVFNYTYMAEHSFLSVQK